jgi:thymidine kinase
VKASQLSDIKVTDVDVIGVDECQFFTDLYDSVKRWVNQEHKTVFCAGLDGDRNMKPFGHILSLIPLADKVKKKSARCKLCIKEKNNNVSAPFTFGKVDDKSQVVVGGADTYQAVCRFHHIKLNVS